MKKQKRFLQVLLSFILAILCCFQPTEVNAIALRNKVNEIASEEILNGNLKLTYGLFGAVGDGVTNDYEAIKKAHDYANKLYLDTGKMVTVYGEKDKTYYISYAANRIDVITNVDWQGCTFIFDDFVDDGTGLNSVIASNPVFDIVPDLKVKHGFVLNIDLSRADLENYITEPITPNTKNVKCIVDAVKASSKYANKSIGYDFDQCKIWGAFIEDESRRWIRKGDNQDNGTLTGELITFDQNGNLLTDIDFTYNNMTRMRVFPIRNQGISVGNAHMITYTNNQVYPSETRDPFTHRGIRVRYTGNVVLHHISHEIDETKHPFTSEFQENPYANYYFGAIVLGGVAYVRLDTLVLTAHTPSQMPGKNDQNGSYDLSIQNAAYVYMDGITYDDYARDVDEDERWGVISTNQSKNIFLEDSTLNRFDAHRGITNLFISNTTIGVKGMTLIGMGDFYAENLLFDQTREPIHLRQDYGVSWDGNMYFKNVTANLPTSNDNHLIYAYNTENWNFGYRSYFPNIYIDGLSVISTEPTSLTLFQFSDEIEHTMNPYDPDNLYYFKGELQVKNVMTSHINNFQVFTDSFIENPFNLLRSSYGGDNQVSMDLDEKIIWNDDPNITDPKFVRGQTNGSFNKVKRKLIRLHNTGMKQINGSIPVLTPTELILDQTNVTLNVSEMLALHTSVIPKNANQEITFRSSNDRVAMVDSLGRIRAIGAGTCKITCRTNNGLKQICEVTVIDNQNP